MIEKGRISSYELGTLVLGFTIGNTLIMMPGRDAGRDGWLALAVALIVGILAAIIYTFVAGKFKGQTPMEYNNAIFGSVIGRVVSGIQLWYFLHLAAMVVRTLADLFVTAVMPETPLIVFILAIVFLSSYTVRKGLEVLSRSVLILVPIVTISVILTVVLLLRDLDFRHFRPLLQIDAWTFARSAYASVAFPFAETVVFIMLIPFLNTKGSGRGPLLSGLTLAGLLVVLASVRNIGVLGPSNDIHTYPSWEAAKMIDVAGVLTRLEILIGINLLTMGFVKIAVLHYASSLGLAQLLGLEKYKPLVFPIGALIVPLSVLTFDNLVENLDFISGNYLLYALPVQVIIPVVALLVLAIRRPDESRGS